jgi:hypothetical protein
LTVSKAGASHNQWRPHRNHENKEADRYNAWRFENTAARAYANEPLPRQGFDRAVGAW